jgi:hypothetical protein
MDIDMPPFRNMMLWEQCSPRQSRPYLPRGLTIDVDRYRSHLPTKRFQERNEFRSGSFICNKRNTCARVRWNKGTRVTSMRDVRTKAATC